MTGFVKRDVDEVNKELAALIEKIWALSVQAPNRSISVALTHLQTAELWLKEMASRTPETPTEL